MDRDDRRRAALVTGAGSGIGRAIAERLARAGDRVTGTVRDPARAEALSAEASRSGLPLEYRPLELTSGQSIAALAGSFLPAGLDLLVHNAGFGVFGAVEDVGADLVTRQFAVNLFGPLDLTRRLLPALRARRGHVIFVGSLGGRIALPFQGHYSASKAAVAALSDALRLELAPHGVRVTCVEPGDFATGFTDSRVIAGPTHSVYGPQAAACLREVERQERGAPDPGLVARLVERLSHRGNPPARCPIGRGARSISVALRFLPDRIRERAVLRHYGLK